MALDPLQAKYPDLSPYNFVANNPLLFIDSDGEKIIVSNAKERPKVLSALKKLTNTKLEFDKDAVLQKVSGNAHPDVVLTEGTRLVNNVSSI